MLKKEFIYLVEECPWFKPVKNGFLILVESNYYDYRFCAYVWKEEREPVLPLQKWVHSNDAVVSTNLNGCNEYQYNDIDISSHRCS